MAYRDYYHDQPVDPSGGAPCSVKYEKLNKRYEVPSGYGDNKIVLMMVDPFNLYAYWEIKEDIKSGTFEKIKEKGLGISKSILRVYEITESGAGFEPKVAFDIDINDYANNWYIKVGEAGRRRMVEIGVLADNGEFFSMARSNMVRTPADGISRVCDDEWMCSEKMYRRLFTIALGGGIGNSSLDLKKQISRFLRSWKFSGDIFGENTND